jgi:integrase/recombinase XerD
MSPLEAALVDYLRLRRSLGHKLADTERHLDRFVAYLDMIGADTVTLQATLTFVLDPDLDPASTIPLRRLTAVRGFARHLAASDPRTEIPPTGLVSYRARGRVPYLFTDDDLAALVRCARASTQSPFRADTLDTLIGLLAVTGMRVSEALNLDRDNIDWDAAVIRVRDSKFHKGRDVPVSASTIAALSAYLHSRNRQQQARHTTRLFVSLAGTPINYNNFGLTFRKAVTAAGIGADEPSRPRIHDLRHGFAIRTVLGWYRAGLEVEALLPRLSTYLGHREPRFTYCYLSATPELLGQAAARLEATQAVMNP